MQDRAGGSRSNSSILRSSSLKARLTFFSLAILVISLWTLSYYTTRVLRADMERLLGEQQFSTVSVLAAELDRSMQDRVKALQRIASQLGPKMAGKAAAVQTFLAERPNFVALFSGGVLVVRADGTAIAEAPQPGERLGVNYMDRDFVAAALKDGQAAVSRPFMGRKLGAPIFAIAEPIRDARGKVIGVLAGVVNLGLPNFLDKIPEHHYGKSGGYLVVDRESRLVVAATDKSRIMARVAGPGASPVLDAYLAGREGSAVFVNPLGVEVLGSVKGLAAANWNVVVQLPAAEAFAPIQSMQRRMLLATIALSVLAGGLTWWLFRRQLAPLAVAARALVRQSGSDQPMRPLPVSGSDEIGQLVGGFNRLMETLGKREDDLLKSRRTLGEAQKIAHVGSWELDVVRNRLLWSEEMYRIFGIPPAGFGASYEAFLDALHPDDRARVDRTFSEAVRTGGPYEIEYRLVRRSDGEVRWGHAKCVHERDAAGKVLRSVGTVQDVTERKRAEEEILVTKSRLQATLAAIPDMLFEAGLDGRLYAYHSHYPDLLGTSPDSLLGKTLPEILPADAAAVCMAALREAAEKGRSSGKAFPLQLRGRRRWFELSVSPMLGTEGGTRRFIILSREATKRVEDERSLRETEAQLRELTAFLQRVREEDRRRFARELHDELGQSLTALRIDFDRLANELAMAPPTISGPLAAIDRVIDATVEATRRICEELRPAMLDDLGLEAALASHVRQFSKRYGVACDLSLDREDYGLDAALSTAVFRIVQEALTNVARHARASHAVVALEDRGDHLQLTVADDGRGLPDSQPGERRSHGLLGMRERVKMLGGDLAIDSAPQRGTHIEVSIPRQGARAP